MGGVSCYIQPLCRYILHTNFDEPLVETSRWSLRSLSLA